MVIPNEHTACTTCTYVNVLFIYSWTVVLLVLLVLFQHDTFCCLLLVPGLDSEDMSTVCVGGPSSSEGEGSGSHRVVSMLHAVLEDGSCTPWPLFWDNLLWYRAKQELVKKLEEYARYTLYM